MKTSKHLKDPVFVEGVRRLKVGEITRADLARELGIGLPTLSKRFGYAGLLEELKSTKQSGKSNGHQFVQDPDNAKVIAYGKAVDHIKANPTVSARHYVRHIDTTLNYQVLCRKLRAQNSTL